MIEWIVTSSALILLVVLLRAAIKDRVNPRLRYALWGLVLVRLLIPGTLWESPASVMTPVAARESYQAVERVPRYVRTQPDGRVEIGHPNSGNRTSIPPEAEAVRTDRPTTYEWFDPEEAVSLTELREQVNLRDAFLLAWLMGAAVVGVFLLAVNLKFNRNLRKKRRTLEPYLGRGVFAMDGLPTPCLFGLFRPAIYLTPEVAADETAKAHVLAHEYAHFRQGDHIWAALRGVCLALHWYNPLVWLAAYLSRRDCELSCDEGAVRLLGEGSRADYGRTLVGLVARRTTPKDLACCATTMTGGKSALKERVALLVKRPRTTVWMACIVAAACIVFAVCTFTGAAAEEPEEPDTPAEPAQAEPREPEGPKAEEENLSALSIGARREDFIAEQIAQVLTDWLLSREEKVEDHRINSLTLREWQFDPDGGIQAVFEAELMVLVPRRESSYWWAGNTMAAEDMTDDFYRDYDGWLVFWREGYAVLDAGTDCWSIADIGTGGYTLDDLNQRLEIDPSAGDYLRFRALPEDLPAGLMDLGLPEGGQGEWLLLAQAPDFDIALYRSAWDDQHVYLRVTNQSFQRLDRDLGGMELLPTLDTVEGDADMTVRVLYRRYEGTYFNGTSYEPGIVADQVFYDWSEAGKYWTEWTVSTQPAQLTEDLPVIADLPDRLVTPGTPEARADMWLIGELPGDGITAYYEQSSGRYWLRCGSSIQAVEGMTVCIPQLLLPELYWADLDGDGDKELIVISQKAAGTEVSQEMLSVYEWDGESWTWGTHDPSGLVEGFNTNRLYQFYEDGTAYVNYPDWSDSILLDLSDQWGRGYWDSEPDICVLTETQTHYRYQDGQLMMILGGEILDTGGHFLHGYFFEYDVPLDYEWGYLWHGVGSVLRSDFEAQREAPALTDGFRTILRKLLETADADYPNAFAVYDINGDGTDELIVKWMPDGAIGSAWSTMLYDAYGREYYLGYGSVTFFDNGVNSSRWYKDPGRSFGIWPYSLYRCEPSAGRLTFSPLGSARIRSSKYPYCQFEEVAYADLDGDGTVYYIDPDIYDEENQAPVDNAVYEAWLERHLGGAKILPVLYWPLTEENISQ